MCSYKRPNPYTAKILALDIGDQWIGVAISDPLGFTAKPLATVPQNKLEDFIATTMQNDQIMEVVVGYPLTLRGTESLQTKKIVEQKNKLEKLFPVLEWTLWDERYSSKKADMLKKATTKEEKIEAHSIAAAFILQSYLDYLYQQKA